MFAPLGGGVAVIVGVDVSRSASKNTTGDAVIIGGDPAEVAQALFSRVGVAVLRDRSGAGIA